MLKKLRFSLKVERTARGWAVHLAVEYLR